ncbi:MAG: preprotein translocase subunit YajC [Gemmatimonadales bacterium]|nr:preprotein translocase subunit YajC [Gemmatimonadales bacterium]NIN10750.1 preprotein translocase subunit YajC [Gemmatimonadales bacterium]NIQ98980.1 preprotein translocase subunit YajC [Gemmatimonadales bacterium]NIS63799.1 preprotein translocase subunit YajC [Gemmatimonadales bacterium]
MLFLFAPTGDRGGGGLSIFLLQMLAIVGIFYFLIIRPKVQQERRHRERLAQIKRGDRIVTAGGIIGEVVHIKDNQLTVKSGDSKLIIQRERVADLLTPTEGESK